MNVTLVALREQMVTKQNELITLGEKAERSSDEESRIDALIAELNDLGPKLAREVTIDEQGKQLTALTTASAVSNRAVGVQLNGGGPVDPSTGKALDLRSMPQQFLESDELKDYRSRPQGKSAGFNVRSFHGPDGQRPRLGEQQVRTLIYSGGTAASLTPPMILPTIYGPRPTIGDLVMRDVLNVGTTSADAITYIKENSFTNAAAAVAEAVSLVTGLKPESALDITEANSPVVTIAHWIPITRQALDDAGQLRSYVEGRLIDGLVRTESNQILNGTGTPPNLTGLLATSGVQALDATYFTANPVAGAGTGVENYNRILRGKTKVATTGSGLATFVAVNPADWEGLISGVNANGVFYGGGPFGLTEPPRLWGLPVVLTADMPAKLALVGDGTMATIWDRMSAQIFIADQHADFFIRNIFVLLAEERLGLTVFRGAAFTKITLA